MRNAVGADNPVIAVDLLFLLNQGARKFGIQLRESPSVRDSQFS